MRARRSLAVPRIAFVGAIVASVAVADVYVVAPSGGDFAQIQAAADFAVDGDVLLVESGAYGSFTIQNEALVVQAVEGADVVVQGHVAVRNLASGKLAVIAGLDARSFFATENAGAVRVSDCRFEATPQTPVGASVFQCTDVAFDRCHVVGGVGSNGCGCSDGCAGDAGMLVGDSRVALYDCDVRGGNGADAWYSEPCCVTWGPGYGGDGGVGVWVSGASFFFASGTTIGGGNGGAGDHEFCDGGGGYDGWGGCGLQVGSTADAKLLDCELAGGTGDMDGAELCGQADPLAGDARSIEIASVIDGGALVPLTYHGLRGDAVTLLVATLPDFRFQPGLLGTLLVAPPWRVRAHGTIDFTGRLVVDFAWPAPPLGQSHVTLLLQAIHKEPSGQRTLTGPIVVTVLPGG